MKINPDLSKGEKNDAQQEVCKINSLGSKIDEAKDFSDIWEIVRHTVKDCMGEQRGGMLLFLEDLPLQLGAYHPLGSNNIVLNRTLVRVVETATGSKRLLNAFVYTLLLHEYLHALGHLSEAEVRSLVHKISRECFGVDHAATRMAQRSPWSVLRGIPLTRIEARRGVIELVRDFEKPKQEYIA